MMKRDLHHFFLYADNFYARDMKINANKTIFMLIDLSEQLINLFVRFVTVWWIEDGPIWHISSINHYCISLFS